MRGIRRLRQPSTVLSQCLHHSPSAPLCRAKPGTSSCLASRPRDLSTTPSNAFHASRARAADNKGDDSRTHTDVGSEPQPTSTEVTAPETEVFADTADLKEPANEVATSTATEPQSLQATPDTPSPTESLSEIIASDPAPRQQRRTEPRSPKVKLGLPPSERAIAPRPDDLKSQDDYTPAISAENLPVLGGLGKWFAEKAKRKEEQDLRLKDNFGAAGSFVSFAPGIKPVSDSAVLELCVHRAVLEALAVRASGPRELMLESWRADGGWDRALGLGVSFDEAGHAEVLGDVQRVVKWLVGNVGRREKLKTPAEAKEIMSKVSGKWKEVSLQNAELKFALAKRVFQLTGQAIPDAKLLHVTKVSNFLATVIKPPPARTVHEVVERHGELAKLPNVKVYAKRRTPIHVAKDLGRWKVVQEELEKRGLPVSGPDAEGGDKFREREWYHGAQPAAKDKKKGRRKQ